MNSVGLNGDCNVNQETLNKFEKWNTLPVVKGTSKLFYKTYTNKDTYKTKSFIW